MVGRNLIERIVHITVGDGLDVSVAEVGRKGFF